MLGWQALIVMRFSHGSWHWTSRRGHTAARVRVRGARRRRHRNGAACRTARVPFIARGDPVHVTVRVLGRLPSLRSQLFGNIVKRALHAQRGKLMAQGAMHFQVVHFSIQDDHIHLIVEAPDKRGLARGVAGLEIRVARRINKILGRSGRFWSDRYHRRDLRTPTETRNVLRYVLLNLRKHGRVFADCAFADPCSSAPAFEGFARSAIVFDDAFCWPRIKPRTWLLGVGWLRHGRIDPADTPGTRG